MNDFQDLILAYSSQVAHAALDLSGADLYGANLYGANL